MNWRHARGWAWVALWVASPAAFADIAWTDGFGPRAQGMGGAQVAASDDFTATFYNPALLVVRKEANVGVHFSGHAMASQVNSTDASKALDCLYCTAPPTYGFGLGFVAPLGGKALNRVALGAAIYLPVSGLASVRDADPSRPHWVFYHSGGERLNLYAGGGIRITDWLLVGGGVQVLANLVGGGANVKLDLFNKSATLREMDSRLATRVAPQAGLAIQALPTLRFGVAYHGAMAVYYEIPANIDIDGVAVLGFKASGTGLYTPHSIDFGVSWDVTPELTLTAQGEWKMWSLSPSPYLDLEVDIAGKTLDALGLATALDIKSPLQRPGLTDVVGGRLGVEWKAHTRVTVRGGFAVRPTPVPNQSVPGTTMMDSTTLQGTAGFGFNFDDPLEVFAAPLKIDIAGHAAFSLSRSVKKEATDSVPSFTHSAQVYGGSIALRYDF